MSIRNVRRISQIFFLLLFFHFCVVASVGERWWELRGWPVNWLIQLDPLAALGVLLTTGTVYSGLLWSLLTLVLTFFLGRFFCGWVCPFGSLHHFFGFLGRKGKPVSSRAAANRHRPAHGIKYLLLAFFLSAAAVNLLAFPVQAAGFGATAGAGLALLPALAAWLGAQRFKNLPGLRRGLLFGAALCVVFAVFGMLVPEGDLVTGSLQTGLLDPLPFLYRSVNLVILPALDGGIHALWKTGRFHTGAWTLGIALLLALLANFWIPRFYCRFVCPLGALFGLCARWSLWRIGKTAGECSECRLCETDCEGGCEPFGRIRWHECVLCMNCLYRCREGVIDYAVTPSQGGEVTSPDLTRRSVLTSMVAGAALVPVVRLGGNTAAAWNANLVRPPGALPEARFVERCIKCGQCMRICPTNILHPALTEAGVEGFWTPVANFRIGSSGCQVNCIACGQVCPTAAIRPLSLEEKRGRGEFEKAGPVRLGTAFVDRGRCLPWAMDRPCIVCEENCPVSPKAIFTREIYRTIRDGARLVEEVRGYSLRLGGTPLEPGALSGGDFYVRPHGRGSESRRRIVGNDASSLKVESGAQGAKRAFSSARKVWIEVRLKRPFVDPKLCIGCGICEHECPVAGRRAIRVTAENESRNAEHRMLP
jgi:polyferredoxin